jgi:hypothetical protein
MRGAVLPGGRSAVCDGGTDPEGYRHCQGHRCSSSFLR